MVSVRRNMDTNIVYVDGAETVIEAANKMLQNGVWSLVVKRSGLPEGVVTERDMVSRCLSKGLNARNTSVEKFTSFPFITIGPEEPLRKALELMEEKKIRRVYVIEDGKIIGRVTQTAAFENLFDLISGLSVLTDDV
jgi:CBS domain-containing protein